MKFDTRGEDLLARGQAIRRGRELIFVEMTATVADGTVIAHGLQTYRIAP